MATADLAVMLTFGLLSLSPLIDLLSAFSKPMVSASSLAICAADWWMVGRSQYGWEGP